MVRQNKNQPKQNNWSEKTVRKMLTKNLFDNDFDFICLTSRCNRQNKINGKTLKLISTAIYIYINMQHNLNRYKQASASTQFDSIVCTTSIRFAKNHSTNNRICIEWLSATEFVYGNNEFTINKWPMFELLPFNLSIFTMYVPRNTIFQWFWICCDRKFICRKFAHSHRMQWICDANYQCIVNY